MNPRVFTFVACRLLAIYMFVNLAYVGLAYLPVNLTLIIILWFAAGWISKHVVNEKLVENTKFQWSQTNVLSVGLCIMGVFTVVITLPQFTFLFYRFDLGVAAGPLISLTLGLLLIFGAERISELITKLRRW